jgi:hypothetical protein
MKLLLYLVRLSASRRDVCYPSPHDLLEVMHRVAAEEVNSHERRKDRDWAAQLV